MNSNFQTSGRAGFTILELLIVLVAFCLLASLLIPSFGGSRKATNTACLNNLKQIALAEIVRANDMGFTEGLPAQVSTNQGGLRETLNSKGLLDYYRALSNELCSPRILSCPSAKSKLTDNFRALAASQLSYFLNADTSQATPGKAIHGDRQLSLSPSIGATLSTISADTHVAWSKNVHDKSPAPRGNLALADGSVLCSSNRDLPKYLLPPTNTSYRLFFP